MIEEDLIDDKSIEDFHQGYSKIYKDYIKRTTLDAYVIQFIDEPTAFFITFQTFKTRDTGKWEACKYFFYAGHPRIGLDSYNKARRRRIPEFDKYSKEGKVPVEQIMKMGASYSCGICGNHLFTYEDIQKGKCHIVKGEGDTNQFTSGIVICNNCRRKYFS